MDLQEVCLSSLIPPLGLLFVDFSSSFKILHVEGSNLCKKSHMKIPFGFSVGTEILNVSSWRALNKLQEVGCPWASWRLTRRLSSVQSSSRMSSWVSVQIWVSGVFLFLFQDLKSCNFSLWNTNLWYWKP